MGGAESKSDGTETSIITYGDTMVHSWISGLISSEAVTVTETEKDSKEISDDEIPTETETESDDGPIFMMDEKRRRLNQIIMLIRYTFRGYFGLSYANRWGYYIDRHMCTKINDFAYWLEYPKSDHKLKGHSQPLSAVAVSSDGRYLFTGSYDKQIRVWDLVTKQQIHRWEPYGSVVFALDCLGSTLVSASSDGNMSVWHSYGDHRLRHALDGHTATICSVSINNNGTRVVSSSKDKSIRVWSLKTGECLKTMIGHTRSVRSAHLLDESVISGAYDGCLKVWNVWNSKESKSMLIGKDIYQLCISCDQSNIACIFNGAFRVYRWPKLDDESSLVYQVIMDAYRACFHPFRPDILAVVSYATNMIGIHNVRENRLIRKLGGHSGTIYSLTFTPDGCRLITASDDWTAHVLDVSDL